MNLTTSVLCIQLVNQFGGWAKAYDFGSPLEIISPIVSLAGLIILVAGIAAFYYFRNLRFELWNSRIQDSDKIYYPKENVSL